MRALKYKLADGTIVNTLAEAKASGQKYKEIFEKYDLDVENKKTREVEK